MLEYEYRFVLEGFPTLSYDAMALDSNGKAHISYYDETSLAIKYATNADLTPLPPSNLRIKPISSSQIVIGWTDNARNEKGYKIERRFGNCSLTNQNAWLPITSVGYNSSDYTATNLSTGTIYSFRVKAYNNYAESQYSSCVAAKTLLANTPSVPLNLSAVSLSTSAIKLTWQDKSSNEQDFRIYRKKGNDPWSLLVTIPANTTSYTDSLATGNDRSATYSYYITACNSSTCSPFSSTVTVPFKPVNITSESILGEYFLTWDDKSFNETGFQIQSKGGDCSSPAIWMEEMTTPSNTVEYKLSGIPAGTTSSYRVRSIKKSSTLLSGYGYSALSRCIPVTF